MSELDASVFDEVIEFLRLLSLDVMLAELNVAPNVVVG